MNEFNKLNELKNLKFQSVIQQDILQAVSLFEKLGYEVVRNDFSVYDAASHNGVCAWDDGEITEGWLDDDNFEQVILEELKEMIGENKSVLWLNKETLKERWLHPYFCFIDPSLWVEVPEGATFATGDKDNFVFRKDGWYYENGEWVETNVLLKHFPEYEYLKLLWVKSDFKDNVFTLERLLGCEVRVDNPYGTSAFGYITGIVADGYAFYVTFSGFYDLCSKDVLVFFTEDGRELYFDEYVELYYPQG